MDSRSPAYAVAKMGRAAKLWNEGEQALAHFHLAYAGLPPCGEDETLRLFLAEECLAAGVTPDELVKAQNSDPALAKYSQDQPRVPRLHALRSLQNDDVRGRFACVFDGSINGETFLAYVEQALAPTLSPGDVIMDNLGSHKVAGVREAIE